MTKVGSKERMLEVLPYRGGLSIVALARTFTSNEVLIENGRGVYE